MIDAGESPRNIKNLLNDAIYKEVMNIDIDSLIYDDNGVPLIDGLGDAAYDAPDTNLEDGSSEEIIPDP